MISTQPPVPDAAERRLPISERMRIGTAARRALQGAFLACGAPLGWLGLLFVSGHDPWLDFTQQPGLYAYMLLGTLTVFTLYGYYLGEREQESESRSLLDGLTGLFNQRYFWQRLRSDLEAAKRLHFPLSLVMLDLDLFKDVNDRYGHAAGDMVLKALAVLLQEMSRKSDTAARVGGEEFALILPFTDAAAAVDIAERMRAALEVRPISIGTSEPLHITASFGVVEFHPDEGETARRIYVRADLAMYGAKQSGRNRVVCPAANA